MRRRLHSNRPKSAEAAVALCQEAHALAARRYDRNDPQHAAFLHRYMKDRGSDPMTGIMALYWIREGKPADFWLAIENGWT